MSKLDFGHYTTQSGLLGIIGTETIWATNIKFLNDEYEFQHALDLIREIIPTSNITTGHREHDTYKSYRGDLEKQLQSLNNHKSESIFTLSFSEETDLLSQWRGYCPDNNGYCLILKVNDILEKAKAVYDNIHFVECIYDKDTKEKQIKDTLNKYWTSYSNNSEEKGRIKIIEKLSTEIMLLASYFKHPSFSEEKEHRIVIVLDYAPDNDLQFREGKFSIIPYLELPSPKECIDKICIGPTSNKQLSRRSLETFLDTTFQLPVIFSELKIMYSKTPYRPW